MRNPKPGVAAKHIDTFGGAACKQQVGCSALSCSQEHGQDWGCWQWVSLQGSIPAMLLCKQLLELYHESCELCLLPLLPAGKSSSHVAPWALGLLSAITVVLLSVLRGTGMSVGCIVWGRHVHSSLVLHTVACSHGRERKRESILKSLQLQYIKQRGECWCVGFPHQHLLVCLQPFVFQTRKVSGVCAAAPVGHRGHIGRKQMYANQSHFLRLGGKRISGFLSFSNGSGCNWQLQSWEG